MENDRKGECYAVADNQIPCEGYQESLLLSRSKETRSSKPLNISLKSQALPQGDRLEVSEMLLEYFVWLGVALSL